MKQFQPFVMERMMSQFEQNVAYNLSESGVHPVRLRELLEKAGAGLDRFLDTELNYPYANGNPDLREHIAALYDGAKAKNVLVTVGAIEANFNAVRTLCNAGDGIVVMVPNYMQIWGVAKNHGWDLHEFHLREADGWAPDLDELDAEVKDHTKIIAVCNPNNPTGRILTEHEMNRIVECADRVGAWILADEVYRGATRISDQENPSFYGRYDKVLAIGSMSKAYGLPGLRVGWVVAPEEILEQIWARHEYTTISATMLANHLASLALSPPVRSWLLERTRRYIREGYPVLQDWMRRNPDAFTVYPPDAAAIAFIRYRFAINSTELMDRLRTEKSVLVVPGDHFGLDHFLRVSFGLPHEVLVPALERIEELVNGLEPM